MDTGPASRTSGERITVRSGDFRLAGYLARPTFSAASSAGRHGIVICHGFPEGARSAGAAGQGFPLFADRLTSETGASVITFNFRGTGDSEGDFSLAGWMDDLRACVVSLREMTEVEQTWLVGFAAGGTLSLCLAAEDPTIGGVAAFAPPADFADRANDARRFVAQARASGVIRTPGFPADLDAWAHELREIRPIQSMSMIPPRPVLIVHGSADEVVPILDARALADAAADHVELRVLVGAGHRLVQDPRAFALLLGWLDRHLG
jgi:pimeloyl-ACP methyl ester carboxylesterase